MQATADAVSPGERYTRIRTFLPRIREEHLPRCPTGCGDTSVRGRSAEWHFRGVPAVHSQTWETDVRIAVRLKPDTADVKASIAREKLEILETVEGHCCRDNAEP